MTGFRSLNAGYLQYMYDQLRNPLSYLASTHQTYRSPVCISFDIPFTSPPDVNTQNQSKSHRQTVEARTLTRSQLRVIHGTTPTASLNSISSIQHNDPILTPAARSSTITIRTGMCWGVFIGWKSLGGLTPGFIR